MIKFTIEIVDISMIFKKYLNKKKKLLKNHDGNTCKMLGMCYTNHVKAVTQKQL